MKNKYKYEYIGRKTRETPEVHYDILTLITFIVFKKESSATMNVFFCVGGGRCKKQFRTKEENVLDPFLEKNKQNIS